MLDNLEHHPKKAGQKSLRTLAWYEMVSFALQIEHADVKDGFEGQD